MSTENTDQFSYSFIKLSKQGKILMVHTYKILTYKMLYGKNQKKKVLRKFYPLYIQMGNMTQNLFSAHEILTYS